ncbi:MAG: plasmid maintenance system killer family protein [Bacteroidetes bacterium]|nr:MAG: plasmid maintenance system killer family protein [Bacteroidota bacterium]
MIGSFGSKETEKIWKGIRLSKLPGEIQETARRKLRMLNNSINLTDLKVPPSNKLEKLKGNLRNFYSIRINEQWRIIFKWNNGSAFEVEITDYINDHA